VTLLERTHVGTRSDGDVVTARIRALAGRLLPPYPDHRVIGHAIVPAPALLRRGMRTSQVLEFLALGYRGAVWRRWRMRSSFLTRGNPAEHKSFPILQAAARLLFAAEIAPAAWCLFSCDAWRANAKKDAPPTVAWVYSANRIRDRQDWFREEGEFYRVHEVRYAPEHRLLAADWSAMWQALILSPPATLQECVDIVDRFFPSMTYEERIQKAKGQVRSMQLTIDNAVRSGELPWT
jgi:hypothetical protein